MSKENFGELRSGCAIIGSIIIALQVISATLPMALKYADEVQNTPILRKYNDRNEISASPLLSGYFPTRGFDYDKDGKLDYVEEFIHGAPRIPYGNWHQIQGSDNLFQKVQEEYENVLRDEEK